MACPAHLGPTDGRPYANQSERTSVKIPIKHNSAYAGLLTISCNNHVERERHNPGLCVESDALPGTALKQRMRKACCWHVVLQAKQGQDGA